MGVDTCKKCHNEPKGLNQYSIWVVSPHAGAVKTLRSSKSKKISEKYSIKEPAADLRCLACHTTGGGRYKRTASEGVGCESCHGPGSSYYEISNHVNFRSRMNGYVKAKKLGMYPILKYEDNLLKREKLCLSCHNNKRLCRPDNINEIRKQKISIQVIDKLRKGDVNFIHPLH